MEPNSPALVVLLVLGAVALLVTLVRNGQVAVRVTCGVCALSMAAVAGMAMVNDYYGYYQTWTQVGADMSGTYDAMPATTASASGPSRSTTGRIETVQLPGKLSGINRSGLVYLPPEYFDPRYAHTDFPVLELIHGTPGDPSTWVVHLGIDAVMNQLIAQHLTGPMILVMPTMNVGTDYQECVDAPGALDDTYITQDVRDDIAARFRVSAIAAEWGIAGFSSGGYCAANLALRHPADFGAAGIMDGYFRPQDGPAAKALHYDATAEAANDPLLEAATAGRNGGPLPAFWMSAGASDAGDLAGVRAFTAALHGVEAVPVYQVPGAGHNFYAWEPALPYFLQWAWTQLAPPDLRVQFPLAGPVRNTTITLSPQLLAAKAALRHHGTTVTKPLPKPTGSVTPVPGRGA